MEGINFIFSKTTSTINVVCIGTVAIASHFEVLCFYNPGAGERESKILFKQKRIEGA